MEPMLAQTEWPSVSYMEESLDACRNCGVVFKIICWESSCMSHEDRTEGPLFCPFCGTPLE